MTHSHPVPLLKLITDSGLVSADIFGNPDVMVTGISCHAQSIRRNEMFVAIRGTKLDSHSLIPQAIDKGAGVVVVDRNVSAIPGVTTVKVDQSRNCLGRLAQAFYNHPTRSMTVCGTTGTNGKTSTSHLVTSILRHHGIKTGLIGTLGAFWGDKARQATTTTPGPLELARIMAEMHQDQVEVISMEVSSHAIDQHRMAGIPLRIGALTSISQDHLDYHGDFPTYIGVKRRMFFDLVAPTPGSVACFNLDDPVGEELFESYQKDCMGFSANPDTKAMIHAKGVRFDARGTSLTLVIEGIEKAIRTKLLGNFNVTNALAAASICHNLGLEVDEIADGLENCQPVPGRFEVIDHGQPFTVVVDYAHTPDALIRLLNSARGANPRRLITVFGCGGDRDKTKRPLMGEAVGNLSDYAIVTSDNPRTEDPGRINQHVVEGILRTPMKSSRFETILDRKAAIEQALKMALEGDMVVVAGKGHEDYMEIGRERVPFSDRLVIREILSNMKSLHYLENEETERAL